MRKCNHEVQYLNSLVMHLWKVSSNLLNILYYQAGNVVTGEMVEQLILNGADIVKVGIGPGKCWLLHSDGLVFRILKFDENLYLSVF